MIVCLINGSHAARERGSEGVTVLDCGCAHTDVLWLQMCRPHMTETDTYHALAREYHDREDAIRELTS